MGVGAACAVRSSAGWHPLRDGPLPVWNVLEPDRSLDCASGQTVQLGQRKPLEVVLGMAMWKI
jgi:hypothetical protein